MNMQIPKKLKILDWFSFFLILFTCWLIFYKTPVEMNMGLVQKIFYFHVAYAWIGMVSFLVAAISAVIFLRKGLFIYDAVTESAVEIGLVFTLIAIITGSIWARPIWNTWWTWDPRLTTT
ncbi:MAG TPA: cytochrome c biogenesis protein CcsA, partial [Flexilinea sp.]|nr:cytochrome c biogenesis protein CcsA [Flexilinea sp.]